jgi:hypothetical protein
MIWKILHKSFAQWTRLWRLLLCFSCESRVRAEVGCWIGSWSEVHAHRLMLAIRLPSGICENETIQYQHRKRIWKLLVWS